MLSDGPDFENDQTGNIGLLIVHNLILLYTIVFYKYT